MGLAGYGWILRRLLLGVVILFVVSIVIFVATQVLPGDPAKLILGSDTDSAQIAALHRSLGLDDPVLTQYGRWLGHALQGDLGVSYTGNRPVADLIRERFVNSAMLTLIVIVIATALSLIIGVAAAARRDGWLDNAVVSASLIFTAVPDFVVGIALVLVLSTSVLHVFPAVSISGPGVQPWMQLNQIALPVLTLALGVMTYLTRHIRASMIEVLESEYVQTARNKGLRTRTILWRHALPNAISPTIQAVGFALAHLIGGVVTVEFIFSYPGMGTLFVTAVENRDLPVIQGVALIFAATYVILNLVVDLLVVWVDPRLRTGARDRAVVVAPGEAMA